MSVFLNPAAEREAVKTLGEDIGFGRIIQLAHECWDEMLETKHGIKNHGENWTLASADLIRERRAASVAGSDTSEASQVPGITTESSSGRGQP